MKVYIYYSYIGTLESIIAVYGSLELAKHRAEALAGTVAPDDNWSEWEQCISDYEHSWERSNNSHSEIPRHQTIQEHEVMTS